MITEWPPKYILLVGFFLVVLGFVLPFLYMIGIIPGWSFILTFVSFIASTLGLFLGIIGSALLYKASKK